MSAIAKAPEPINVAEFTPELIAELQAIMISTKPTELLRIIKTTAAPQSAEEAIRKLLEPSKQRASAQEIISEEGVEIICDAVKRFHTAVFVRRLGCAVCMNLGSHDEEMRTRVASGGAIVAIRCVLTDQIDNIELLCVALGVLNSFSTTDAVKVIFAKEEIVPAVFKAITTHPTNSDVLLRGLTVLANCCLNHGGNQEQLRTAGGVVTVMKLLESDSLAENLTFKAAAVFDAISAPKVKEAMLEADGVNVLFKVMSRFPLNSQLQLFCLGTIRSLGAIQPEKMLSAGVFTKMKGIMTANMSSTDVVEQCLAFVCGLALADSNKDAVVEAGGLAVVKEAMTAHPLSANIQHWCCRCLQVLAFRKENIKLLLVEQGFLPLLYAALKAHETDEGVQEQGLASLTTLAANKTIKKQILSDGGLDLALRAKDKNATNEIVTKNASNLQIQLQFSDRY